ncbi:hypothetical protein [Crossiella cryophila]|uniref:Secreted protein n=1 Tax=Crossiella cryophila TaxID=43355 RepID=A0A7W7CCC2_9PSEU|nr:hypothetical protein [Crossiella cryophila]MBB4678536.1 hypothetical protein [Crossiella cryophila]
MSKRVGLRVMIGLAASAIAIGALGALPAYAANEISAFDCTNPVWPDRYLTVDDADPSVLKMCDGPLEAVAKSGAFPAGALVPDREFAAVRFVAEGEDAGS